MMVNTLAASDQENGAETLKMALTGDVEHLRASPGDSPASSANPIDLVDAMFPTSAQARELRLKLADRIAGHGPCRNARLVAAATVRLPAQHSRGIAGVTVAGHLVRIGSSRAAQMRYVLLAAPAGASSASSGDDVCFTSDESQAIERAISARRRGHRGGLGRGQGRKSVDGVAYPRRVTITLTQLEVGELMRLGAGNVCAGIRELARRIAAQGQVGAGGNPSASAPRRHFVARLDPTSEAVLRAAGEGSITRGVSRALAARRPSTTNKESAATTPSA
jgi:hypothetical protein